MPTQDFENKETQQLRAKSPSPWAWIPTLYIAEGLPYFAVNSLTVLMFVNLGIGYDEMAFYTGWLYLPWVIKPFWSPFIDLFGTKRRWTIAMQWLIACSMAAVAFLLPVSYFFAATLAAFWFMAFFSATHDIAADGYYMLALSPHDQAAYVGIRSTFYRIASVIGQGGLIMMAGYLEQHCSSVSMAWQIVFAILALFFIVIAVWHTRSMARVTDDRPIPDVTAHNIISDFGRTFVTFFQKKGIISALLFMLLYRLPEAFCVKMVQPFMVASRETGGLGLTTAQVGFVNGTVGVIALLTGGIIGGLCISAGGLKRWLWPMAAALTLPCALYAWLAAAQPCNLVTISVAVAVEQFGYGFGFTAFMLYLIYFSRGASQTSHYAFCTAFMAIGMMIPGMFAGKLYNLMQSTSLLTTGSIAGFENFFWVVTLMAAVTFGVCTLVKINPQFGKKR